MEAGAATPGLQLLLVNLQELVQNGRFPCQAQCADAMSCERHGTFKKEEIVDMLQVPRLSPQDRKETANENAVSTVSNPEIPKRKRALRGNPPRTGIEHVLRGCNFNRLI